MKKLLSKHYLLYFFIIFTLSACKKETPKQAELVDITIKTAPQKEVYYIYETLDLAGLVVSLTYDNGDIEHIPYSEFDSNSLTTSPENGTSLTDSTSLIITHTPSEESIDYCITVKFVVEDIEGNTYSIIKIGDQIWMGENLKTSTYNDGSSIPLEENDASWSTLTTDAYCWYDNNKEAYGKTYGALYNWHTVNTNKLCPVGWHVPTEEEWTTLVDFLGGEDVAGGKIKEAGTLHWNSPNEGADNSSDFTGLPSGSRSDLFHSINDGARWWSSTQFDSTNAWALSVNYTYANSFLYNYTKSYGHSVRCIKD